MSDEFSVESTIAPPALSCPKCNGMLPNKLGEIQCALCDAKVKIEHEGTRKRWKQERVSCPSCSKVLIVGVDKRPADLKCASCETIFTLKEHIVRVEIACPGCERNLRMKRRPGIREITCPACETEFKVNF